MQTPYTYGWLALMVVAWRPYGKAAELQHTQWPDSLQVQYFCSNKLYSGTGTQLGHEVN